MSGEPNDTAVISRNFPRETSRPWTSGEIAELRRLAPLGAEAAADGLGRSVASVKMQAHRLRISLRPPASRGGLLLGQPRAVSFLEARDAGVLVARLRALREDVLSGRVDAARAERRGRLVIVSEEVCPACGVRPQEVVATGFCEPCHLKALAEGHRLELEKGDARRELDRERQRKSRRHRSP